jgi:hypothetical protein
MARSLVGPCLLSGRAGLGLGLRSPLFLLIAICNYIVHTPSSIVSNWRKLYFSMWAREGGENLCRTMGGGKRDNKNSWSQRKYKLLERKKTSRRLKSKMPTLGSFCNYGLLRPYNHIHSFLIFTGICLESIFESGLTQRVHVLVSTQQKKVSGFPIPNRDVTNQTLPGRE